MKLIVNILTFFRILAAVLIFILIMTPSGYLSALILFFLASLSDYYDGFLARKYNSETEIGEILDPIADKVLIIFVFFGLAINLSSYYIGFMASIILSREILVGALRDFNARNNRTNLTKVTTLAKMKTAIQLFTISIYLFGLVFNNMFLIVVGDTLLILSTIITVYTGYIYINQSFKN